MHQLGEAIVIAAVTLAPFALGLLFAGVLVAAIGAGRLGRLLGLDVQDGDR